MERGPFAWRITIPSDGRPPLDGLVPALIAWSSERPALGLIDRGCRLVRLEARHPDPGRVARALGALGVRDIAIVATGPDEAPAWWRRSDTRRRATPGRRAVNDGEVRRIAEAFALGRPNGGAVPVARGEMGRIWRLDTDRGRYAVKELLYTMDVADAQADVAFQRAALDAGLPMPRPVTQPDGAVLLEIERPGGAVATFRVYSWVDLARPNRPPRPAVAAALLARLQRLDRPADGPMDAWFAEPLGAEGWASLVGAVREGAPPWLEAFVRLAPDAEAAEAVVTEARLDRLPVVDLRRCHLDYNPENILLDAAGEPVILDWENSGSAPYEQELAYAVLDFAAEPASARDFLRAYHDADGPATITGRSSFAMAIAVQSHLADTYARRGALATSEEVRDRMAYRIDELDRTLFTLESIDRLLDALET